MDDFCARALADTLIRRVLTSTTTADLATELERVYPFAGVRNGRRIWLDAFLRHSWTQSDAAEAGTTEPSERPSGCALRRPNVGADVR